MSLIKTSSKQLFNEKTYMGPGKRDSSGIQGMEANTSFC